MFEADTYCLVAAAFSSVVCLVSFALFWFFEERPGLELVADASVFLVLGLAMTAVAWSKNWMERASFNTGAQRGLTYCDQADGSQSVQHDCHYDFYSV